MFGRGLNSLVFLCLGQAQKAFQRLLDLELSGPTLGILTPVTLRQQNAVYGPCWAAWSSGLSTNPSSTSAELQAT